MTEYRWVIRDRTLTIRRPLVMGIVNTTPDSFSDGGRYLDPGAAVAHGLTLVAEGADILDVGGESTRPGAQPVPADEELRRVLPVARELARQTAVPVSVDTSKASVARACLDAGAHIVNDVTALTGDPAMPAAVRESGAGAVLMHMRGTPLTMQLDPRYGDVVGEIDAYLEARLSALAAFGIAAERLAVDPGVGFGKTFDHTLATLTGLGRFCRHGRPVCLGVSRKGFIGQILGRGRGERLAGGLAVACLAVARGAAQILRVHDVAATRDAVTMMSLLTEGAGLPRPSP